MCGRDGSTKGVRGGAWQAMAGASHPSCRGWPTRPWSVKTASTAFFAFRSARRRNSHQSSGTKTRAAGNEGSPGAQHKQAPGQQGTDEPPAPREPEGKLGRGRADSAGGTKRAQKSGPQAARRTEQQGREAPPGAGPAPQTNRRKKRGGRPGEGGKGGGARRGAAGRRSPLSALCLIILRKIFHRGATTMCM